MRKFIFTLFLAFTFFLLATPTKVSAAGTFFCDCLQYNPPGSINDNNCVVWGGYNITCSQGFTTNPSACHSVVDILDCVADPNASNPPTGQPPANPPPTGNGFPTGLGAPPAQLTGLESVFSRVLAIAIGLAGVAFFIMFVMGGFKYITSGGDPKGTQAAQKTISYAIFGVVAVAIAYLLLLLISNFTGVTSILNFQIGQ